MISLAEIIIVYAIVFFFAGMGKAYRDLFSFRPQDLKLPKWGKVDDGSTDDSWHYGDGFNDIVMASPFFYFALRYFLSVYEWYFVALFTGLCILGYWLWYYQVFLWCYHYFFNKKNEIYRILNGYKFWR